MDEQLVDIIEHRLREMELKEYPKAKHHQAVLIAGDVEEWFRDRIYQKFFGEAEKND